MLKMMRFTVGEGYSRERIAALVESVAPSYRDDAAGKLAEPKAIAEAFNAEADKAYRNVRLSDDAKIDDVGKASLAYRERMLEFKARVPDVIARRIETIRTTSLRRVAPSRPPAGTIEADFYVAAVTDLRRQIAALDELTRVRLYMSAEDPLVLDAIESAPTMLIGGEFGALVPAVLVEERRGDRARAAAEVAQPEVIAELDALEQLHSMYSTVVNEMLRDLAKYAPAAPVAVPAVA